MKILETYTVKNGVYYFAVFIVNEFDSIVMDEFAFGLN